jgi:hypothetical protein
MAQAKKLNIYKVTTQVAPPGLDGSPAESRVDYVRAKTKQGAVAMMAAEYISADIATTDELLALAKITVKGGV